MKRNSFCKEHELRTFGAWKKGGYHFIALSDYANDCRTPSVKSHILYPAQALTFYPFSALEKPHRATAMLRFSALKKNKIPTA